jgi:acyl-CoA thioesterase
MRHFSNARERLALSPGEEAELELDRTIDTSAGYIAPPEVNRRISYAEELIRNGKKREARRVLEEMRRYTVKNPRYWWVVLRTAQTRSQAIGTLKRILSLQPDNNDAWHLFYKLDRQTAKQWKTHSKARQRSFTRRRIRPRNYKHLVQIALFALISATVLTVLSLLLLSGALIS